jgi:CRISPR-associated exonuclease Cas4
MSSITGTQVSYLHTCLRKLWLFSNQITMEQTSEVVADGKFLGETTYEDRADKWTQVALDGVKIDFYDAKNGVVHETKRSDKMELAHVAQVKYYLYVLEQHGIAANYGILEYPKQRHTERVELTDEDRKDIRNWKLEIEEIVGREVCPAAINKPFCKQCSYCDFCYVNEP